MSEMTPEPTSQDLQLAPPPAPAAALPQTSPNFARRLTAAIVAAVILATGAGVGTGWALARVISSRYPTQVHVQTVQPIQQSTSSGSTNLDINAITRKVSPAVVDINTVIQTASGSAASGGPNGWASVGASSGITGSSRWLPSPVNTLNVTGSGEGHIIGQ